VDREDREGGGWRVETGQQGASEAEHGGAAAPAAT
jgi:hypothetical protein